MSRALKDRSRVAPAPAPHPDNGSSGPLEPAVDVWRLVKCPMNRRDELRLKQLMRDRRLRRRSDAIAYVVNVGLKELGY